MKDTTLSTELNQLKTDMAARHKSKKPYALTDIAEMAMRLSLLTRMAQSMEQELNVHRLGEANMLARHGIDDAVNEALTSMAPDTSAKIVRPEFGRRS